MKKTILAVILLAVVAVTTVIAQESARNFQYDLNEAGNGVVIKKYIGSNTNLVIPRTIEGYPVVEIGSGSNSPYDLFAPRNTLVSVVVPEGVREISSNTFDNQKNLTSVTLPSTLKVIGGYTFESSGLRTVRIPDSVEIIEKGAFSKCVNLTDVNIPVSIKRIGSYAFYNCKMLSNVTIPAGIKSIKWEDEEWRGTIDYSDWNAFSGCALTIAARRRLVELGYSSDGF